MWIYAGAVAPELTDRSRRTYSADELRNDVSWAHSRRHPDGYAAQVDITHRGLWQRKALEFLIERYGFPIDPRSVLTPEDYNQLKYQHGLPVHRQPRGRCPVRLRDRLRSRFARPEHEEVAVPTFTVTFDDDGANFVTSREDLSVLKRGEGEWAAQEQFIVLQMLAEKGMAHELPNGFTMSSKAVVRLGDEEADILS